MATPGAGSDAPDGIHMQRDALRNRDVVVYVVSHLLAVIAEWAVFIGALVYTCLLYTSPSPRDGLLSRMPSSA